LTIDPTLAHGRTLPDDVSERIPARDLETLLMKIVDQLGQRLLFQECGENEFDSILHLAVGMLDDATVVQANQSRGERQSQLTAFGLADDAGDAVESNRKCSCKSSPS
jgi:hypothetical protein